MGIAKFYSWLRNKNYRGALQRYVPQHVSSFSFDLNGLIHNVAQIVYAYGEGENPDRKKLIEKMDPRTLEAEFHHTFGTKLAQIIAAVSPKDTLVLAVDGVAPQAKIAQQRQRRFRAAMDSSGKSVFSSNSITPGTEFMKRLDGYIQRWIIAAKNTLPPKIVYSSHMVKNEGEHKIFSMFRNGEVGQEISEGSNEQTGAHVVYGMDADLVMLSMLSPLNKIFLMREDVRDVIDIDNLKTAISEEIGTATAISDFVVMIFLIGNDFLPHLPTLGDMEEAIETMIRIYKMSNVALTHTFVNPEEAQDAQKHTQTRGTEIHWEGLSTYLSALALEEPRLLEMESEREVMFPSSMMKAATTKSQVKSGIEIKKTSSFDVNVFRGAWYNNAFELKGPKANEIFAKLVPGYTFGPTNAKIVELVKNYLIGIAWVYRYYNLGTSAVNEEYVYRYLYAPLISDIAATSKQFVVKTETYEFNVNALEINPVHQLLSVLPLTSKDLLPVEVQHLMNSDSLIGDYFPETELLDRQGYNTLWQGTLLINFVNMKRIQDAVERTSVFTEERIREFSPVLTVVLVKDKATLEMDERTRKLKSYLSSSTGGRGGGRGQGNSNSNYIRKDDGRNSSSSSQVPGSSQQGRGYGNRTSNSDNRNVGRGYPSTSSSSGRGYSGRGYSDNRSGGRGYSNSQGRGRGQGFRNNDNRNNTQGRGFRNNDNRNAPQSRGYDNRTAEINKTANLGVSLPPVSVAPSANKIPLPVQKFEL
jgi:5'-3' exonuclease